MVAGVGRTLAAYTVRRSDSTKLTSHTVATLPARQMLRVPAKQRLDYAGLAGGGTENPRRRQDQRRIAHSAGGAAVRGGIGRGNRRRRVGLRAHQPPLCAAYQNPRRKTGWDTANRSSRESVSALGDGGA